MKPNELSVVNAEKLVQISNESQKQLDVLAIKVEYVSFLTLCIPDKIEHNLVSIGVGISKKKLLRILDVVEGVDVVVEVLFMF